MWLEVEIEHRLTAAGQVFDLHAALQFTQRKVVLFGPSGAGKSLTLKAIAGLLKPTRGHIRLLDRTLFSSESGVHLPPQQRRIGYVFQDYALFPHLTLRQNVAFGVTRGWRNAKRGDRLEGVEKWLQALRIDHVADALPHQLSGGQRQRTALARALVTEPQALLLDEPFAALDHHLRAHLRSTLDQVLDEAGIPLLLITHDPEDVEVFGQQVVRMADGHVVP